MRYLFVAVLALSVSSVEWDRMVDHSTQASVPVLSMFRIDSYTTCQSLCMEWFTKLTTVAYNVFGVCFGLKFVVSTGFNYDEIFSLLSRDTHAFERNFDLFSQWELRSPQLWTRHLILAKIFLIKRKSIQGHWATNQFLRSTRRSNGLLSRTLMDPQKVWQPGAFRHQTDWFLTSTVKRRTWTAVSSISSSHQQA